MNFVSYAQNFEDVMLWRALGHIKNGCYIDVGANDPIVDSVTKAFYDAGWSGINIEPLNKHWLDLQETRNKDINLQCAAGSEVGEIDLWEYDIRGWATASQDVANIHAQHGHHGQYRKVSIRTLSDICAEYVKSDIHFLKIDVEGFEKNVLLGMDFAIFRPWIVVVEATKPNSKDEVYEDWEYLVLNNKYSLAYCDGLNRFYVADEHSELLMALRYPPNVFDNFIRAEQLYSELRAQQAESRIQVELNRVDEAEDKAQQAEDKALKAEDKALKAEDKALKAEDKAQQAEDKALKAEDKAQQAEDKAKDAQKRAYHVEQAITAIYSSRSWRITYPMRWSFHQARLLRELGFKKRSKALIHKVAKPILNRTFNYVDSRPQLRQKILLIIQRLGLYTRFKSIYRNRNSNHISTEQHTNQLNIKLSSSELSPRARQIYQDLKTAIETNKEQQ